MPIRVKKPAKKKLTTAKTIKRVAPKKSSVGKVRQLKKVTPKKTSVKKIETKKPIERSPSEKTKLKMEAIEKALRIAVAGKRRALEPSPPLIDFENIGTNGDSKRIAESKFNIGVQHNAHALASREIPNEYGKDLITLLIVDPRFVFTYWEIKQDTLAEARHKTGTHSKLTLRFYDVTHTNSPEMSSSWDVEIFDRLGNWYLKLEHPEQRLCLDIGLKSPSGEFLRLARSNILRLPPQSLAKPGPIKWMVVTPHGEKLISDVEEYTDADLELLKKILGPYFFDLLMRGRFASIANSSIEAIFYNIETLRVGESPSSRLGFATHR